MLALWDFFYSSNPAFVLPLDGPSVGQGVVVTHADGTGIFFQGYFCGVEASPAPGIGLSSANLFDSGVGPALSLIPFDPTNPATPRALSYPLQHGDTYQLTLAARSWYTTKGALPPIGFYTSSTINNALPIGLVITIP